MSQSISRLDSGIANKAGNILLWVVQVGAAFMFLMAGSAKLTGDPKMVGLFSMIGIGQWFRYLTGGLEVVGAILLLIPALSGFGASLLVPVMIGAVATHLFIIGGDPTMAVVLLVAVSVVAWMRRKRSLSLLGF